MNSFVWSLVAIWVAYCFIDGYLNERHNGWKEVLTHASVKFFIYPIMATLYITVGSWFLYVIMGGYS